MKDLFEQLRESLDLMGIGFPAVPGVDIPYLKKLFTEEHARVFLAMQHKFQKAEEVAQRLDTNPDDLRPVLDKMADKGLAMTTKKDGITFYAPLGWLTGWGDWTAMYEDRETAMLEGQYKEGFLHRVKGSNYKRDLFRTVPIYETIPNKSAVMPYDDIRKIVQEAESISVSDCFCDRHFQLRGQPTFEPLERCLIFGLLADYLIEKGFGRKVTPEEATEILDKCRDAGLVHNVSDFQNPVFICNCGDHCGGNILRRQPPGPFAEYDKTNNYCATVDTDLCAGCEVCVDRCWFKAIEMEGGVAKINQEVCAGCGVCVVKCPVEAISLHATSEHYTPPLTHPCARMDEEYKADLEKYGE
jgi:Pyruvate/2-oxoacid:ferredoxin oxidoreductase delta subunit